MLLGFNISDVERVKELFLGRIDYYEEQLHAYDRARSYRNLMIRLVNLLEERPLNYNSVKPKCKASGCYNKPGRNGYCYYHYKLYYGGF